MPQKVFRQRIQPVDGNTNPGFGTQITYKPSAAVTLNYSTFIGDDKLDSTRRMRYYHNLYGIFQLNQQRDGSSGKNNTFVTTSLAVSF